ncbi:MAG: DUF4112 domain-containing protein [Prosthecobacter sp.]
MQPDRPDHIDIDEILPPEKPAFAHDARGKPVASDVAQFLAKWLDNWLRIPGTDFKIGLDPLLSLIPGFGSTIASGGGLIILIEAVRSRVSVPVLVRMAGNMLMNTLFDFVPALGPVASAFFKSNSRNLRLLQDWQAGQHDLIKRSTWRLFGVLGLIVAALIGILFGLFALYVWLLTHLFHA